MTKVKLYPNKEAATEILTKNSVRDLTTGCLLWTRGKHSDGYGAFRYGQVYLTHQVAWFLVNGPITEGKVIRHTCDVRHCIEITHLKEGTQKENIEDMCRKGRNISLSGEANGRAILTENVVNAIRKDNRSHSVIAKHYGVKQQVIDRIKARTTWRNVIDD